VVPELAKKSLTDSFSTVSREFLIFSLHYRIFGFDDLICQHVSYLVTCRYQGGRSQQPRSDFQVMVVGMHGRLGLVLD
jgi:hypothetical protein